MTQLLASVMTPQEAELAIGAGADIIDLKNPHQGALGALPVADIRKIIEQVGGRRLISATVGDLPMNPALIYEKVAEMADLGVDIVKFGLFGQDQHEETIQILQPLIKGGLKVVAVLFADKNPDISLKIFNQSKCYGVMMDTAKKSGGSLVDSLKYNDLQTFVNNVRKMDMKVGLAGSLQLKHISMLVDLQPDYLGFRGALCHSLSRTNELDKAKLEAVKLALQKCNTSTANA